MNAPAPRAEYTRRMHRVLEHVDAHLDQALDLTRLAAVAHFSPFHFHRQFTAWMGETLADYIRRRRLEVAALRLLTQPRSTVLAIALTVGFGSGEAFARAFQLRFGCSATQWRRVKAGEREAQVRKLGQAVRNLDQAPGGGSAEHAQARSGCLETDMTALDVKIIDRPVVRVAYLRYVGPYGPGVHAFWQQKFYPFLSQHGLLGRTIYGISHDDPDIAAPEKCRYDTCVEVNEAWRPAGEALISNIPAGRYAVLPFNGTSATIGDAWRSLMRDWLPASGYQLDGRPTFELYPPDSAYDEATGRFECDIVIPLAPL